MKVDLLRCNDLRYSWYLKNCWKADLFSKIKTVDHMVF